MAGAVVAALDAAGFDIRQEMVVLQDSAAVLTPVLDGPDDCGQPRCARERLSMWITAWPSH